jgi:hypothetical protein
MEHNTSGGGGEPPVNDNDDNVEQGSNYGSAIRPALIIHETHIMTEPTICYNPGKFLALFVRFSRRPLQLFEPVVCRNDHHPKCNEGQGCGEETQCNAGIQELG